MGDHTSRSPTPTQHTADSRRDPDVGLMPEILDAEPCSPTPFSFTERQVLWLSILTPLTRFRKKRSRAGRFAYTKTSDCPAFLALAARAQMRSGARPGIQPGFSRSQNDRLMAKLMVEDVRTLVEDKHRSCSVCTMLNEVLAEDHRFGEFCPTAPVSVHWDEGWATFGRVFRSGFDHDVVCDRCLLPKVSLSVFDEPREVEVEPGEEQNCAGWSAPSAGRMPPYFGVDPTRAVWILAGGIRGGEGIHP